MAILGDEDAQKEAFRRKLNKLLEQMVAKNWEVFNATAQMKALLAYGIQTQEGRETYERLRGIVNRSTASAR